jgi:uncharacterized protein YceK
MKGGIKMKNLLTKILPIAILAIMFSGCVSVMKSPVLGVFYNGTTYPGAGTGSVVKNDVKTDKTGTSTCSSILSLFAFGDCSVDAAKKNGNITKVNSVDHKTKSYFIFYTTYSTVVQGE